MPEEWEKRGSAWAPVQWSHCFGTALKQSKDAKVLSGVNKDGRLEYERIKFPKKAQTK